MGPTPVLPVKIPWSEELCCYSPRCGKESDITSDGLHTMYVFKHVIKKINCDLYESMVLVNMEKSVKHTHIQ